MTANTESAPETSMENFPTVQAWLQDRGLMGTENPPWKQPQLMKVKWDLTLALGRDLLWAPGITTIYPCLITQVPALPPDLRTGSKTWCFQRKLLLPQPWNCLVLSVVILQRTLLYQIISVFCTLSASSRHWGFLLITLVRWSMEEILDVTLNIQFSDVFIGKLNF